MMKNGKQSVDKKKLLAINFGGIGDEILFLPTLRTIKKSCPNWSITLLLEPRSRSVSDVTELIDGTITFDIKKKPLMLGDLVELLALIKDGGYDCVVSSGGSPLVSALLFLSGVRERVGYGSSKLSRKLLTQPVPLNKNQYAGSMYHDLAIGFLKQQDLAPPVVTLAEQIPQVSLKPEAVSAMRSMLEQALSGLDHSSQARKIILHPGTSQLATQKGIIKTWPCDRWVELIKRIGENNSKGEQAIVILVGGPDDKDAIADIEAGIGSAPHLVSVFGKTRNLADLAALISLCDLMVCVDSAPMHVAVGLNSPTVALFGPTTPSLLIPKADQFRVLWDDRENSRSMFDGLGVEISVDDVFSNVVEMAKLHSSQKVTLR